MFFTLSIFFWGEAHAGYYRKHDDKLRCPRDELGFAASRFSAAKNIKSLQKQETSRIIEAEDPIIIIRHLERPRVELNSITVAAAIHRMGVIVGERQKPLTSAQMELLKNLAIQYMPEWGARELSNSMWAFAKMGNTDDALWKDFEKSFLYALHAGRLDPQSLGNGAWAFARAERNNEEIFDLIAQQAMQMGRDDIVMGGSAIQTAWAFSHLRINAPNLFKKIKEAYLTRDQFGARPIDTVSDETLSALAMSMGHASENNSDILNETADIIAKRAPDMKLAFLASSISALNQVGIVRKDIWDIAVARLEERKDPLDFYTAAEMFAELTIIQPNKDLTRKFIQTFEERIQSKQVPVENSVKAFEYILKGFREGGFREPAFLRSLMEKYNETLAEATPLQLTMSLYSLARVDYVDKRFVEGVVSHFRAKSQDYSISDRIFIAWSLVALNQDEADRKIFSELLSGIVPPVEKENLRMLHQLKVIYDHDHRTPLVLSPQLDQDLKKFIISDQFIERALTVSPYEERIAPLFKDIPGFKKTAVREQYNVGPLTIDFAFPNQNPKVALEIDGKIHYDQSGVRLLGRDKMKNRYLEAQGWQVVRIKNSEIDDCKTQEDLIKLIQARVPLGR